MFRQNLVTSTTDAAPDKMSQRGRDETVAAPHADAPQDYITTIGVFSPTRS